MASKRGILTVRVVADTKAAERGLDRFNTKVSSTGDKLENAGKKMTAFASVPVAAAMGYATKAASDLEQAVGGTEAVFGEARDTIDDFAETSAKSMGLSEREFREATTSIGGQFKRMTGDVDLAAERSVELAGVAADLAATYGGTTADAVNALGAAFRGEADPAERFNLNLKIGAVNAKAVEMGLAATTSQVDESARAQATYALIMEQSADAQGQFAREADTAAGSMQIARAEMENAAAELGDSLAPIAAKAAGGVADLARSFSSLPEPIQNGVLALAGVTAVAGPMLVATGKVIKAMPALSSALDTVRLRAMYASTAIKALAVTGGVVAGLYAVKVGLDALGVSAQGAEVDMEELGKTSTRELAAAFRELANSSVFAGDELEMFEQIAESNIGAAKRLRDELKLQGEDVTKLDEILGRAARRQQEVQRNTDAASDAVDEFGDAASDAEEPTAKLVTGLDKQKAAAERLERAVDNLKSAQDRLIGVNMSAEQAVLRSEAAYDDLTSTLAENGTTMDATTEKGRANRDAILGAAGAALAHVEALREQGASTDTVNFALGSHVERLKETMRQAGLTEAQIDEYIATLGLTPDNIDTIVRLDGVAGAEQELANLVRDRNAHINVVYRNNAGDIVAGGRIHARHTGGPVSADTPYLVGRPNHEELFVPDRAGHIISGPDTDRILGRKGGANTGAPMAGATINITNNFTHAERAEDVTVRSIRKARLTLGEPI